MPWTTNGSIALSLFSFIEDIPTAISGTPLNDLVEVQRQFVQDFTGYTIGSNSIQASYQLPIFLFSAAELCNIMNVFGVDAGALSLGDLKIDMGGDTNLEKASDKLRDMAWKTLNQIGRRSSVYKSNG